MAYDYDEAHEQAMEEVDLIDLCIDNGLLETTEFHDFISGKSDGQAFRKKFNDAWTAKGHALMKREKMLAEEAEAERIHWERHYE